VIPHRAILIALLAAAGARAQTAAGKPRFVDLSLLVDAAYPCTWPAGYPQFQINHYLRIGPASAYNSDVIVIDPNTGTQLDVPPHSIPRPGTNLPNAGPLGRRRPGSSAAKHASLTSEACATAGRTAAAP
jgi:hypothetical protein